VPAQTLPHGVVGPGRRPHELAGVGKSGLLALVEALGALELEQLVVVPLG